MDCTCEHTNGPSRGVALGFPQGIPVEHPEQRCPFTALVLKSSTVCRCCPLCTILCLPRKTIALGRKRAEFGDLYAGARELGI